MPPPTPGQIHRRIRRLERAIGAHKGGDGLPPCETCNSGEFCGPSVEVKDNEPVPECRCPDCGRRLEPGTIEREYIDPETGLTMLQVRWATPRRKRKTPEDPGPE